VDAPEVVDLVDEAVSLARGHRSIRRVIGASDVDASGRTNSGAKLATDALLHPVLVTTENVASVEAFRLGSLLLGILIRDLRLADLLAGDRESFEVAHG
jgi:hypothetical protein